MLKWAYGFLSGIGLTTIIPAFQESQLFGGIVSTGTAIAIIGSMFLLRNKEQEQHGQQPQS